MGANKKYGETSKGQQYRSFNILTEDGNTKIDVNVKLENGTTQKAIAELYQKGINTFNEHIKNIYEEEKLQEETTVRKKRIVQTGHRQVAQVVAFYNHD